MKVLEVAQELMRFRTETGNEEEINKMSVDKLAQFRRKNCGFVFQQTYLIDSLLIKTLLIISSF